jgi:hypothetical protein
MPWTKRVCASFLRATGSTQSSSFELNQSELTYPVADSQPKQQEVVDRYGVVDHECD